MQTNIIFTYKYSQYTIINKNLPVITTFLHKTTKKNNQLSKFETEF